ACGGANSAASGTPESLAVRTPESTQVASSEGATSTVDTGHMDVASASVGSAVLSPAADAGVSAAPSCSSTRGSPACQMSCGCAGPSPPAAVTLDCLCAQFECQRSIEDTAREICPSPRFQILQGCGRLSIGFANLTGSESVFDAQSGTLIGLSYFSDVPEPEFCGTYGLSAGRAFNCPDAKECSLCGPQQKPFAVASAQGAIENVLQSNCGQCHGPPLTPQTAQAGMNYINDVDKLVATGKIIPLNSAGSPIIQLMQRGEMPPPTSGLPPVTEADISTVAQVIDNPFFWPGMQVSGQDAGSPTPALEPCVYKN
ncbi:MAG: hypothetical protein RL033_3259, partial [Pseudomonadota bacterium]